MTTSQMITSQVSVLLGTVPLFAVNRISLNEEYQLPSVGDRGLSQSTSKITRTVQIEAALLGAVGPLTRLGLEMMANVSQTLQDDPSSAIAGIPLVAGLTTLMDMQIASLSFTQSAEEKDVYAVSISLKHCPRPGLMALLSEVTNAASAIGGAAALASASPRKV
jgi:hypothetical protein